MVIWLLSVALALAQDPASARSLIERQLKAFEADDAVAAFELNSVGIRARFGTPEYFLEAVRVAYRPVYRPESVEYGALGNTPFGYGMWMKVGHEGASFRVLYLLEAQADGTWKIDGCFLFESETPPSNT